MGARSGRERWFAAVVLVGTSFGLAAPTGAQDARKAESELRGIESDTQQLLVDPLLTRNSRSATHVEERLTDGQLFYQLQDYVRASIILTDVVDNYPQHRAMPDALFLLGESLYSAGDYLGARTRFRQLISRAEESAFRPYAARSLGRLIEIAIKTRDFDGVEDYFEKLSRLPPQEVEAATTYFRAKYLYNKAVPTEDVTRGDSDLKTTTIDTQALDSARLAFEAVAESSPYFPQARYFVGVILTLQRQFPQAVEAFRRVLRAQATTPEHAQVIELAQLAMGRLFYETDQLDQAVEAYQSVPRTSKWFDAALYEIAWVYIRMGDSTRAERALEVLQIAAPESRYLADGSLLRGNLLLRNGNLEEAALVFKATVDKYGPVRQQLDQLIAEHADTKGYFRSLVRENMEVFDANSILPPEAVRFATEEAEMQRALSVLSDLSQARGLVKDTSDLIRRLDGAIRSPNAVNVFVDLRRQRQRTTAVRNRATALRRTLLAMEEKRAPASSGELAEIRAERHKLEASLADAPKNPEDFEKRDNDMLAGFKGLTRDISKLEVEILGMEARVVATDRFLVDTQDARTNSEGIAAMQNELVAQRGAISDYQKQIQELKFQLESGRLQVGVGDARYERDAEARTRYNALVDRERALLASQDRAGSPQVESMFRRMSAVESSLAKRDAEIDRVLAERAAEINQVLAAETTNVEGYKTQLAELETEAEDVIGGVTYASFVAVRARFYDLVLRADVGTIDVSWADREEHRMRVEILTRGRAREIRALDDEFQEIMDEPKSGDAQ